MTKYFLIFSIFLFHGCNGYSKFNGGFESVDRSENMPVGWSTQPSCSPNFRLDNVIKKEGRYSLSMENTKINSPRHVLKNSISINEEGNLIELRGFIKTDKVRNGSVALWLKLERENKALESDRVEGQKLNGTRDWAEYRIRLPFSRGIRTVSFGSSMNGMGKAWIDNVRLYIDGKLVNKIQQVLPKKAETDTSFIRGSRISAIGVNLANIKNLAIIGQFWGFLKYHHPRISTGEINWDAELFILLGKALKCKNYTQLNTTLESYLDSIPNVNICKDCNLPVKSKVLIAPDYGDLLSGEILSRSLTQKLRFILENRSKENYWIKPDQLGVPQFTNEKGYEEMIYPDAGYRLLSLYRYWAAINYYYPYKNLSQKNWTQVLSDFIPQFIAAENAQQYTLTTLRLIAMIKDTHGNIWGGNKVLEAIKGRQATPFQAKFIENKLVITGYFIDTLNIKKYTRVGDIIVSINGKAIGELLKQFLPLTPASNYETQLRDLPMGYLLRSNDRTIKIVIKRGRKKVSLAVPMVDSKLTYQNIDYTKQQGYYLVNDKIGYIYAGKYKNSDLPQIKQMFSATKGIIVDLRCYPSNFMPFTFGNFIKPLKTVFSKFSKASFSLPGCFTLVDSASNGSNVIDVPYKGKVIAIVNSNTQSQGEYTTMAFQSSPNVKVVGSQTAGADGNITGIILPGGIYTMISGIGVFYPDNSPTQGVGVKIDYLIKPTIEGVTLKKDELMEKAIHLLNSDNN